MQAAAVTRLLRVLGFNALAVALGIGAALGIIAAVGGDVWTALTSFLFLPLSDPYNIAEIFVRFIPLYTIGLGIGLALKAGLWNVGGEGQFLIGAVLAIAGAIYIQGLPPPLHLTVMLLLGALGGLLWIIPPAVLRARFGANEIVVTLLLNIVAIQFTLFALDGPIRGKASAGYMITDVLPEELRLPVLIPGTRLSIALIITLAIAVVMYLLVEKTPFGVHAKTVGESWETARYAGISIPKIIMTTMLVAGALGGLAGALHVTGVLHRFDAGQTSHGFGYLAIIVAMLGRKNMAGIGLAALFFAYIIIGAENMSRIIRIPFPIVYAMEGVMLAGVTLADYFLARRMG